MLRNPSRRLEHNEPELALDALEHLAESSTLPATVCDAFAVAAESMDLFGPPNDESFAGHPLASRGLHPYGAFEVSHLFWIRRLEKMNSVHPYHRLDAFWRRRHIVFAFHDTTLECVCDGFEVRSARGSIESVVPEMVTLLEWSAG